MTPTTLVTTTQTTLRTQITADLRRREDVGVGEEEQEQAAEVAAEVAAGHQVREHRFAFELRATAAVNSLLPKNLSKGRRVAESLLRALQAWAVARLACNLNSAVRRCGAPRCPRMAGPHSRGSLPPFS